MPVAKCDVMPLKKGQKRGTMRECAKLGKISYWGSKKIDPKLLKLYEKYGTKDGLDTNKLAVKYRKLAMEAKSFKAKLKTNKIQENKPLKKEIELKIKIKEEEAKQIKKAITNVTKMLSRTKRTSKRKSKSKSKSKSKKISKSKSIPKNPRKSKSKRRKRSRTHRPKTVKKYCIKNGSKKRSKKRSRSNKN